MGADGSSPIADAIWAKLSAAFPRLEHLEVANESSSHAVAPGSETHFRVVLVSSDFQGQPPLERHRAVNATLAEELAGGVHALSIVAKTPTQWAKLGGCVPPSPPCLGGAAR